MQEYQVDCEVRKYNAIGIFFSKTLNVRSYTAAGAAARARRLIHEAKYEYTNSILVRELGTSNILYP